MHAGLVHYQQNLGCEPAVYSISYNNEDPGTQVCILTVRLVCVIAATVCVYPNCCLASCIALSQFYNSRVTRESSCYKETASSALVLLDVLF